MYKITYLPIAQKDLQEILLYIADQLKSPQAALDLMEALEKAIALLDQFPYAHPIYPLVKALDGEYRLLPVKSYAVFYLVKEAEKVVEIQRILYAKMNFSNTFKF
ncbi:type II toxin-antitoxin system mRNA interferase toxin, RelE/StbE family [Acetobacterium paludosum]|uniref:Type II toxin-antitoxin system mRNA interferase toxin, RelE/StbE family n=1 Tax=Acetobacterium paludosum TaxID=52693 RepID=A0A923KVW0_9FIRM|nr:type II toxin-antitoxin system RelE/ParE family toxin [Acetobacterium paludosum]MBC3887855.1 type II toxin-antitoxin system mRNA interferase toxin, RelE/StbE family [Acetobacterium paludosum]